MNNTPLIIFDLDGTLARSKQPLSPDMATLLGRLLESHHVAVISGGALPQFSAQVVDQLPDDAKLWHLYLLPTSGAAFYIFEHDAWKKVYEERLSEKEAHDIETVINEVIRETPEIINPSEQTWGKRVEYRGPQVTLSALGQQAPPDIKKAWDPDRAKRKVLRAKIAARLPGYNVVYGGSTSIDVTKLGMDKAYGIHKLCDYLHIKDSDALYVGDELGPGGNDEAVFKTGVQTKEVKSLQDTQELIQSLL